MTDHDRNSSWIRNVLGRVLLVVLQTWVRLCGRPVTGDAKWLHGYEASGDVVGPTIVDETLRAHDLIGVRDRSCGLLGDFEGLRGSEFDPHEVDRAVHHFYERTSQYSLGCTPHWSTPMAAVAKCVIATMSRVIDQCNLPLDARAAADGMTNEVIRLHRRSDGSPVTSCWLRRSESTGRVVYAGFYGAERPPGATGPCVKVSFPLPGGYICVLLQPVAHADGSFELVSHGREFGDAGFYLVQRDAYGRRRAVRAPLRESIRVGVDAQGELYAIHRFHLGATFLRLDYELARATARHTSPPLDGVDRARALWRPRANSRGAPIAG